MQVLRRAYGRLSIFWALSFISDGEGHPTKEATGHARQLLFPVESGLAACLIRTDRFKRPLEKFRQRGVPRASGPVTDHRLPARGRPR